MSRSLSSTLRLASVSLRPAMAPAAASAAVHRSPVAASACAAAGARSLSLTRLAAGPHHVPMGPKSNIDGVYRRPEVPEPTAPLSEDDELVWDDAQAPEHTIDQWEQWNKWDALRNLVGALTVVFGGTYALINLRGVEKDEVPIEYENDNLRLSRGGPRGAPAQ